MKKPMMMILAGVAMTASLTAGPADAQRRGGGSISIQGANHGGTASRSVDRQSSADHQTGSSTVTRGIQTNSGAGATTTRGGSWANGTYSGGKTTTTNNGTTFGRTTTATGNGNGSGTVSTTATGPNGQSRTVSGTVTKNP